MNILLQELHEQGALPSALEHGLKPNVLHTRQPLGRGDRCLEAGIERIVRNARHGLDCAARQSRAKLIHVLGGGARHVKHEAARAAVGELAREPGGQCPDERVMRVDTRWT